MATRLELNRETVIRILDLNISSLKRRLNTEHNPAIKTLVDKDLSELILAKTTISDIK